MVDTLHDPMAAAQDLRAHRRTFYTFSRLILFAILHIALVLGCLALAFLGDSPLIAAVLGVGGTAIMAAVLAMQ